MINKNEIMELVKRKEEIENQINEKLGIENVDKQATNDPIYLNLLLNDTLDKYNDLIGKYSKIYEDFEQLYEIANKIKHTSDKQSFKEMLYIDFLDLKDSNDSKTYEEFKNYIEIVKNKPQVKYDLDVFMEAIEDIEFHHLYKDFFENEYDPFENRTDGLDVYSCKNDFKKINNELVQQ